MAFMTSSLPPHIGDITANAADRVWSVCFAHGLYHLPSVPPEDIFTTEWPESRPAP